MEQGSGYEAVLADALRDALVLDLHDCTGTAESVQISVQAVLRAVQGSDQPHTGRPSALSTAVDAARSQVEATKHVQALCQYTSRALARTERDLANLLAQIVGLPRQLSSGLLKCWTSSPHVQCHVRRFHQFVRSSVAKCANLCALSSIVYCAWFAAPDSDTEQWLAVIERACLHTGNSESTEPVARVFSGSELGQLSDSEACLQGCDSAPGERGEPWTLLRHLAIVDAETGHGGATMSAAGVREVMADLFESDMLESARVALMFFSAVLCPVQSSLRDVQLRPDPTAVTVSVGCLPALAAACAICAWTKPVKHEPDVFLDIPGRDTGRFEIVVPPQVKHRFPRPAAVPVAATLMQQAVRTGTETRRLTLALKGCFGHYDSARASTTQVFNNATLRVYGSTLRVAGVLNTCAHGREHRRLMAHEFPSGRLSREDNEAAMVAFCQSALHDVPVNQAVQLTAVPAPPSFAQSLATSMQRLKSSVNTPMALSDVAHGQAAASTWGDDPSIALPAPPTASQVSPIVLPGAPEVPAATTTPPPPKKRRRSAGAQSSAAGRKSSRATPSKPASAKRAVRPSRTTHARSHSTSKSSYANAGVY